MISKKLNDWLIQTTTGTFVGIVIVLLIVCPMLSLNLTSIRAQSPINSIEKIATIHNSSINGVEIYKIRDGNTTVYVAVTNKDVNDISITAIPNK